MTLASREAEHRLVGHAGLSFAVRSVNCYFQAPPSSRFSGLSFGCPSLIEELDGRIRQFDIHAGREPIEHYDAASAG
jgi:hypothetical protein